MSKQWYLIALCFIQAFCVVGCGGAENKAETEKQRKKEAIAEKAKVLGKFFMKKKAEFEKLADQELDEYIQRLIDSGQDVNDPIVQAEIEEERIRIRSKYF